jgi:hypothetical protein
MSNITIKYIKIALLSIFIIPTVSAASGLPIYGNWCGPGFPVKGENPIPIDIIDEQCKQHDLKYDICELHTDTLVCEAIADLELVDSIRGNLDGLDRGQLLVANNIAKYFSVQAPMKKRTDKTKKLFMARFDSAIDLDETTERSLGSLNSKYTTIKNKVLDISDIIANKADGVISKYNDYMDSSDKDETE